ncbi:hypothetical protein DOTSEDRAFT_70483 [Dothistroma septosporum NZE10]|uniref:Uncharacterized protein n=1 Tax=Dothistroma septosporum (strain NZE10 / CBS 128990) TaxID=675120 RepID=N1PU72_DOTSN|nr:hypothetical protein DOTSEDRAFT_70483 [Dothistroma septosporum NZE10]
MASAKSQEFTRNHEEHTLVDPWPPLMLVAHTRGQAQIAHMTVSGELRAQLWSNGTFPLENLNHFQALKNDRRQALSVTATMPLIDLELVPSRTASLHHTFLNTATRMRQYDTGEWLIHHSVLRESKSMTGLRQHPRHVTRLSRMGSLGDVARHVEMWGEKRGTIDTVYAIAENGRLDEEDKKQEERETPGRPPREHEGVSLLPLRALPSTPPAPPPKSSTRQKVEKHRAVGNLTKLLEAQRAREELQYNIFGKHLQSERTFSENMSLGFEYGPPGSKDVPVIHAVLDQDQQEAINQFRCPRPPADWGLPGAAAEEVSCKDQDLRAKLVAYNPIRKDFAHVPGNAPGSAIDGAAALFETILKSKKVDGSSGSAACAHDAQQETLGLARSAGDSKVTTQQIKDAAARALVAEDAGPQSYFEFEQGRSKKCNLQPSTLLRKLKGVQDLRSPRSEPRQHAKVFEYSKVLIYKLKQSLSIRHRRAGEDHVEHARKHAEAEAAIRVKAEAEARAKAKTHINFQAEKQYLLLQINAARRERHQRWLGAEQDMARAQDRPPHPVPPVRLVTFHKDLEADARITATALDTAYDAAASDVTKGTKWRADTHITKLSTLARSGDIRIIGPPNYGILCLCNLWLNQGLYLREQAMEHLNLIEQGRLPRDHFLSGCDCYKYRIYEAFTSDETKYIGIAQARHRMEDGKEKLGKWVVYLAKQKPKSRFELGSRMPSMKLMVVPERRPTSADISRSQRSIGLKMIREVKRHSRRIVFFHDNPLRDVGGP